MRAIGMSCASAAICAITGSDPLPTRRRAVIERDRAVPFEHHADVLARAGAAAFEIAADRDAVAAAADQLALHLLLFSPAEILEAAVQRLLIIAGVGFTALIERLHVRE